ATYPDFDFNKFVDYLSCGVWKFLVNMLSQFILFPAWFIAYYGAVIAIVATGALVSPDDPDANGRAMAIAAAFAIPLAIMFLLTVTLGVRVITNPLVLKASLSGDPKGLFDLKFLIDFVKRTWKEMICELLWVYVTFPVMLVLGLACLCIGVYPAIFLSYMADAHTNWQLYEIYLARGGAPIPLKSDQPAPVMAMPQGVAPPLRIAPVDLDAP
ncbi:MAG: hypothetical protein KDA41_19700, partial [Planctomycetales bacterium]|nr:hypothetical protein [Planctomycetales bacterium]